MRKKREAFNRKQPLEKEMIDARKKSDGGHDNIKINMNRQKKNKEAK